jgi:hypothetical protein
VDFSLAARRWRSYRLIDMVTHIALGIAFAVLFLALGCVAFYFLLRGGHDHE